MFMHFYSMNKKSNNLSNYVVCYHLGIASYSASQAMTSEHCLSGEA